MSRSFSLFKSVLYAIMGMWAVVTVTRFLHGLGATTGLNDSSPWGLWIAFDVMAGVALAAGGFVLAATVYIFGLRKYHAFARPAILTAFLGYIAVAIGLLYDLGLPWNIWHPIVFPQFHSVLFEVALCVMLYLTVLTLEFAPVILEHPWFDRPILQAIHKLLKALSIPLVIAGIVLSTLHQSSLGSLFLIQPFRVHPLWYSPIVYVLFFISAVGLGLMMVALESLLSGWFFGHEIKTELLAGLGRVASFVLFGYVALRLGDLLVRGKLGYLFDGSWQSFLFMFELFVSALLPAVLLAIRRVRTSVAGMGVCSVLTVMGMMGYRFNICIVTFTRPDGLPYLPTWMEIVVSLGVVSGAILTFIFFVEHLRVYEDEPEPEPFIEPRQDIPGVPEPYPAAVASPRRYSLIVVATAALTVGFLPEDALFGPNPVATPVAPPRTIDTVAVTLKDRPDCMYLLPDFVSQDAVPAGAKRTPVKVMLIDGNRDDAVVPFNHARHVKDLGDDASCVMCHHQNIPYDQNTSCHQCHRDMYEVTDTFNHTLHVARLGDNASCATCHADDPARKTRATAKACQTCHADMIVRGSRIKPPQQGLTGYAVGYMEAMHALCIGCHEDQAKKDKKHSYLPLCSTCHKPEIAPVQGMPPSMAEKSGR